MLIIPAIDLKGGKAVRLWQGDFSKVTEYSDSPESVALEWQRQGAQFLHIVDLDGAYKGSLQNLEVINKISKGINVPFEVGGGVRSFETIEELINLGAAKIVLGTKALGDKEFLKTAIKNFKDKIIVSIDARDGNIAVSGWINVEKVDALEFAKELKSIGLSAIIYTDISRDGTLGGPNLLAIKKMLEVSGLEVIASGGVSSLDDLEELKKMENKGLRGVIVGKALYENKFSLKEASKVAGC